MGNGEWARGRALSSSALPSARAQLPLQIGWLGMLIRVALVLVVACAVSQATDSPAAANTGGVALQQNRNWISQRGSVWVWNRDENGVSLEMTVRGEVEFNDDYTEVKRVADGGSLEVRESREGSRRRLEIEAGPGGGLRFSYFVNGQ